MDMVTTIMITAVVSFGLASIVFKMMNAKREGNQIPWDKIRPIVTEVFTEVLAVAKAKRMGYETLEAYAVIYIKAKVEKAPFLTNVEKAMITKEMIKSIIGPRLKELYSKGL